MMARSRSFTLQGSFRLRNLAAQHHGPNKSLSKAIFAGIKVIRIFLKGKSETIQVLFDELFVKIFFGMLNVCGFVVVVVFVSDKT